jgi:SAM-dependent methyltransferase
VALDAWEWDPSLYSGSAAYYPRGRLGYPKALADALATELHLDGSGRLLDVGCGPGSLTLPLAGMFEQAIGIDADRDMIDEAGRLAAQAGIRNTRWLHMRAEELPKVAAAARGMLDAGGACGHVHATTHQGIEEGDALPHPRPPHSAIAELVRDFLGPERRAGRSTLPHGTATGETEIYQAAGFTGPRRIEVPGRVVTRVTDDLVAAVFSLSSSTPHLFGDRRAEFEAELRQLLLSASPSGVFSEQSGTIAIDLWRP